jgi:hypothetical protein
MNVKRLHGLGINEARKTPILLARDLEEGQSRILLHVTCPK